MRKLFLIAIAIATMPLSITSVASADANQTSALKTRTDAASSESVNFNQRVCYQLGMSSDKPMEHPCYNSQDRLSVFGYVVQVAGDGESGTIRPKIELQRFRAGKWETFKQTKSVSLSPGVPVQLRVRASTLDRSRYKLRTLNTCDCLSNKPVTQTIPRRR